MRAVNIVNVSVALALSAAPLISSAQDTHQESEAAAAFAEGIAHYRASDYVEAAEAFRRANQLHPNWKLLYNIGQSEAAAKRSGLALQAFEEYLTRGGDDIPVERRDEVVQEIRRLKLLVGLLEVVAPDGATIIVDGMARETTPAAGPIMVSAGIPHKIEVVLGDDILLDRTVRLVGERTTVLRVADAGVSDPAAAPSPDTGSDVGAPESDGGAVNEPSTPPSVGPKRIAGWTLLAVGVSTAVAGAVVGGMALSRANGLVEEYPNGIPSDKSGEVDAVNRLALSSDILLPTGLAAAAAGAVLLIIGLKTERASDVSVRPVVGPASAGVTLGGHF